MNLILSKGLPRRIYWDGQGHTRTHHVRFGTRVMFSLLVTNTVLCYTLFWKFTILYPVCTWHLKFISSRKSRSKNVRDNEILFWVNKSLFSKLNTGFTLKWNGRCVSGFHKIQWIPWILRYPVFRYLTKTKEIKRRKKKSLERLSNYKIKHIESTFFFSLSNLCRSPVIDVNRTEVYDSFLNFRSIKGIE